jgi:hypothetical protein
VNHRDIRERIAIEGTHCALRQTLLRKLHSHADKTVATKIIVFREL